MAGVSYGALGCWISQASTSVLASLLIGKPVSEAMKVDDEFLALMQSQGEGEPDEDVLGDAVAFVGVSDYPARSLVAGFRINWVWLPPWGLGKITEDGREQLRALGFNL